MLLQHSKDCSGYIISRAFSHRLGDSGVPTFFIVQKPTQPVEKDIAQVRRKPELYLFQQAGPLSGLTSSAQH